MSPILDPMAWKQDALQLQHPWGHLHTYALPVSSALSSVIVSPEFNRALAAANSTMLAQQRLIPGPSGSFCGGVN